MLPWLGIFMFGWERQNSPIDGSRVNPFTPWPVVYTSMVEEPYIIYPAAVWALPGCRKSSLRHEENILDVLLYTENIVPTETFTSMLEDPSRGSMAMTYFEVL